MDWTKATIRDASIDLATGQATSQELPPGYGAVLKVGDRPDNGVRRTRSEFATHTVDNPRRTM
jgi:hypothetical protein